MMSKMARGRVATVSKDSKIKSELIAAVTNLGKHDRIHPTVALSSEKFPEEFSCSCARFLLDN